MNYNGPGIYQHYKGGLYEVIDVALQEDTVVKGSEFPYECSSCGMGYREGEEGSSVCASADRVVFGCSLVRVRGREMERNFVIYRPLSVGSLLDERSLAGLWARDINDFNEEVPYPAGSSDQQMVPRFRKLNMIEIMRIRNERLTEWARHRVHELQDRIADGGK